MIDRSRRRRLALEHRPYRARNAGKRAGRFLPMPWCSAKKLAAYLGCLKLIFEPRSCLADVLRSEKFFGTFNCCLSLTVFIRNQIAARSLGCEFGIWTSDDGCGMMNIRVFMVFLLDLRFDLFLGLQIQDSGR